MKILFAPDYRVGNPYQELLADALTRKGVEVSFLSHYRRGLPLSRGSRDSSQDLIHLHWPEKYFARKGDAWDWLRVQRYPLDYWLTTRHRPVVLTAHNLLPHNRAHEPGVARNFRLTGREAGAVFVHSPEARTRIRTAFGVRDERIHVIPFGDHGVKIGTPIQREKARAELRLSSGAKICLMFGTVSPYKGADEVVRFWSRAGVPHHLAIVGPVLSEAFARTLRDLSAGCPTIDLRLASDWLSDGEVRLWLSAADCCIFNYREILTSGAAALARSYGIPVLIPARHATVDLMEPHPHVLRFESLESDFGQLLEKALGTPCSYDLARQWRDHTSWDRVADMTLGVYRKVLNMSAAEEGAPSSGASTQPHCDSASVSRPAFPAGDR
jgi:glycosyltransferase involved in cell wall biosynthesis